MKAHPKLKYLAFVLWAQGGTQWRSQILISILGQYLHEEKPSVYQIFTFFGGGDPGPLFYLIFQKYLIRLIG